MNSPTLRRSLLAFFAGLCSGALLAPATVFAFDPESTAAVNADAKGVALKGHDPVAYFTAGKPTPGKAEFSASHAGATYQFANASNRELFVANAENYAPQYGGFCAFGMTMGKKFDGDPQAWHVSGDKLYVNLNPNVQQKWLKDVSGHNMKADLQWPQVRNKTPKSVN